MRDLVIEVVENGFIVYESNQLGSGIVGKRWVFASPATLSAFIYDWAELPKD
jgi:hypothetical protein